MPHALLSAHGAEHYGSSLEGSVELGESAFLFWDTYWLTQSGAHPLALLELRLRQREA